MKTEKAMFSFGEALVLLKAGKKLCREGWHGRGMWIVLQKGYPDGIPINRNTAEATGIPEGSVCRFAEYIMVRTPNGCFCPWAISCSDVLATDWREWNPPAILPSNISG
jgi:hypothetical protein